MEAGAPNSMKTETPTNPTNNSNDDKVEYDLKNNRGTTTTSTSGGNVSQNNNNDDNKQRFWYFNPSVIDPLIHGNIKDEKQLPKKCKTEEENFTFGMVFIFCVIFGIFIGIFSSPKLVTLILLLSIFIVMTAIKPEITDRIVTSILTGISTVYLMLRYKTSNNTYCHNK